MPPRRCEIGSSRELDIARRVESAHVCRLLDVAFEVDGRPLLVWELLAGETLAQRLQRQSVTSFSEASPWFTGIWKGLIAVHAEGVVHRDIKPSNIFLHEEEDGSATAKLLDFGVAKLQRDGDETSLTSAGAAIGTFDYMAPEQFVDSAKVTASADVYAACTVIVRTLVGRLPFPSDLRLLPNSRPKLLCPASWNSPARVGRPSSRRF